jgi:hypothetical protein
VCGQYCHPVELADGSRAYRSVCGCRLSPLDALTVERLVLNAVEREVPALLARAVTRRPAALVRLVFAEVVVGGTVDDLSFVPLV